jgi:hypothetical protein
MDVQSQLLFIGSSADMNRNYGGRTEEGSRTGKDNQHTRRCPSPVLPLREETRSNTQDYPSEGITLMRSFTTVRDDRLAM